MGHVNSKELTIYTTDKCNLNCVYCYPGDYKESYRVISSEFVISAIDYFLRDQSGPCNIDKVRFYALGEPTLEIDLIKTFHF
jgi:sulfatase maturation enzyme AslB (radical SAM superfamily)